MQFTATLVVFFAAMGATATPVEPIVHAEVDSTVAALEANVEGEMGVMVKYSGTCNKSNQQCRFTMQGKTNIVKCPSSPANHRCTSTGKCTFDSYNRKVQCS